MEQLDPALIENAQTLWQQVLAFAMTLLKPWRLYQLGIIVGIFVAAQLLTMVVARMMHKWMRTREGWPKWRMRMLVLIHRRIRTIIFVILAWLTVAVLREYTWPSRSYLVALAATLATAWLLVSFLTRLIRNGFLRKLVRWGAWIYVTLYLLELTGPVAEFLDSAAVSIGEFNLSLLVVLKAIVITALLFTGARLLTSITASRIRANEEISPSMQVLAVKIMQIVLFGLALILGLKSVGFDLTGLAVLSGAIGLGIGFGLQKVVSNLISGVIILLDKSVKPGDVISLGETFGWINALGARYVSVVTRDGKEYLIPNEDLITSQVVNWSHSNEFVRLDIFFGASYDDDPHEVRKLAVDAAKSVDRVLVSRPAVCHVVGFGDSSVDYILRFWISDATAGLTNVRGAVFLALWDALHEAGVSIPFPQREVKVLPGSQLETTRQAPPEPEAKDGAGAGSAQAVGGAD